MRIEERANCILLFQGDRLSRTYGLSKRVEAKKYADSCLAPRKVECTGDVNVSVEEFTRLYQELGALGTYKYLKVSEEKVRRFRNKHNIPKKQVGKPKRFVGKMKTCLTCKNDFEVFSNHQLHNKRFCSRSCIKKVK